MDLTSLLNLLGTIIVLGYTIRNENRLTRIETRLDIHDKFDKPNGS